MDGLQQCRKELITVGIYLHLIILEGQRQVLVDEEINHRAMGFRQMQILLLGKLQHRTLGQLVHGALTDQAFLARIDTKEEIKHEAHHRHKPYHHRPCHRLGRLTVVHNHMDHRNNGDDLPDQEYDIKPTHPLLSHKVVTQLFGKCVAQLLSILILF